jgi:lipoprotein-anchoring transpeptidase ErfK/SrfK
MEMVHRELKSLIAPANARRMMDHEQNRLKRRRVLMMLAGCMAIGAMAASIDPVQARGRLVAVDPDVPVGSIFIDTDERRLYFFENDGWARVFPVAVGREGFLWTGETRVTHKRIGPTWRPTSRMRAEDPSLPESVPPGPRNPLGAAAIYLADATLRIHGTNSPRSVGRAASSGCFRMFNADVLWLERRVRSGARVVVR